MGSDAGIMTDISTLPRLSSFLKELMAEHKSFDVLPFLQIKLLSHLEVFYDIVPQDQRTIRGEIAKPTNELVSESQPLDSAELPSKTSGCS